jgi:hypothetical protein
MRFAIAFLLLMHGVAHGVGFVGAWGLRSDMPAVDHLLGGAIALSPGSTRLMGVFWLLAGLGVFASGIAAALRWPLWLPLALGMGAASLLLCLLTLPITWIGAIMNVAVMLLLTLGLRQGWAWAAPH